MISSVLFLAALVLAQKPSYSPNNLPATTEQGPLSPSTPIRWLTSYRPNRHEPVQPVRPQLKLSKRLCQLVTPLFSLPTNADPVPPSIDDFCLWAPPSTGQIGATESIEVAYCTTNTHGTRVMPPGTITNAHFVETPSCELVLFFSFNYFESGGLSVPRMFSDRTYRRRLGSGRGKAWTARAGVGGQRRPTILLGSDEELVTNSFLQTIRSRATETSPRSTSLLVMKEESSTL